MNCYEITVDTTNGINDTFKSGGKYHDCEHGVVYVFAKGINDAAKQIPEAKSIRLMGPAFPNGER